MKPPWHVHRTLVAQHDGERRGDEASQCLLQWAVAHEAGKQSAPWHTPEDIHGSRAIRTGLNIPSTTAPDDRSTTQPSPRLCRRPTRLALT